MTGGQAQARTKQRAQFGDSIELRVAPCFLGSSITNKGGRREGARSNGSRF